MKFHDKTRECFKKVIRKFEEGDFSTIAEIVLLKREGVPFDNWSFSNKIIAYFQTGSLDCRGYKQWLAVNRNVKHGEKAGAYIIAPMIFKNKDENGKEVSECKGFKAIAVFCIDQTEGEPIDYGYGDIEPPPLVEVANHFGLIVTYEELMGAYGSANLETGNIRLATADEHVFFHELVHAIRIKLGLVKSKLNKEEYAKEEIIAEFTATVLAEMYGKNVTAHSKKYIERYADGTDAMTAILEILSESEKVLSEIAKVKELEMA